MHRTFVDNFYKVCLFILCGNFLFFKKKKTNSLEMLSVSDSHAKFNREEKLRWKISFMRVWRKNHNPKLSDLSNFSPSHTLFLCFHLKSIKISYMCLNLMDPKRKPKPLPPHLTSDDHCFLMFTFSLPVVPNSQHQAWSFMTPITTSFASSPPPISLIITDPLATNSVNASCSIFWFQIVFLYLCLLM